MTQPNKKKNIVESLSLLFDNISKPSRSSLIGVKIDKILCQFYSEITGEIIAKSLLTQYGSETLLPKNGVFQRIILSLNENQIENLAKALDLSIINDPWSEIAENISQHYEKLIEYFNQDEYFKVRNEKDLRLTNEIIGQNYGVMLKSLGFPHAYQNSVKLELQAQLKRTSGKYRSLIVMPTGSGKTRTAIEFLIDFIRQRKKCNVLWIVDSPNLSEQALQSFKELWQLKGDREISLYRCFSTFAPDINFDSQTNVIFGAFDKVNNLREENSLFYNGLRKKTNLLIIDEAHFSLAQTYENTISDIEKNSDDIIKIGLTATPLRTEDNEFYNLKSYFNSNIIDFKNENGEIIENPLKHLQDNEFLARIDIEYLSIPEVDIDQNSRDFNLKILERIKISVHEKKQIIVFAMSKDHAIALNILLQSEGVKSECIIGDTSAIDRLNYFSQFQKIVENKQTKEKSFELNVIINYNILATGIDLPKVDELFLLRKFGNETTAMQVLGRALRGPKNGGNKTNKVISVIGNSSKIADESQLFNLIKNMY
jgi:DNA repair protein RadD